MTVSMSKRKITPTTFSGVIYFKGPDNKIVGFSHIPKFLTTDFLQLEIHIASDRNFKFAK